MGNASSRRQFLVSAAALGSAALVPRAAGGGVQSENPFSYRRNWGRWGSDDQKGAVNLITPAKRAAAAALVKTGRSVSIGRVFEPEQHFIRVNARGAGHSVVDCYGFMYHGVAVTHVDALSHMWEQSGMWNGRDPDKEIDTNGARFGDRHRRRTRRGVPRAEGHDRARRRVGGALRGEAFVKTAGRYLPLKIARGTGSPANPIALF